MQMWLLYTGIKRSRKVKLSTVVNLPGKVMAEGKSLEQVNKNEDENPCTDEAYGNLDDTKVSEKKKKNKKRKKNKNEQGNDRKNLDDTKVSEKKNKKEQVNDRNNADSREKGELAGLIFMCSSNTKQDCFRYRVFGLPSAKRDVVEKAYPGMTLFLFDFDLRLMYGIYKASSRGGNEIEPKAFRGSNRSFPAQVRFRIHKDCLPLCEDIFKNAIKDNYVGRNKFRFELNTQQVKNLCKLFRPATLNSGPAQANLHGRAVREERSRRSYEGRQGNYTEEDSRQQPYDDYTARPPLRAYGPADPVICERQIGYGIGGERASFIPPPYTDYVPKPILPMPAAAAHSLDIVRSDREMLAYGARASIISDEGPDSYGRVYHSDALTAINGSIYNWKY